MARAERHTPRPRTRTSTESDARRDARTHEDAGGMFNTFYKTFMSVRALDARDGRGGRGWMRARSIAEGWSACVAGVRGAMSRARWRVTHSVTRGVCVAWRGVSWRACVRARGCRLTDVFLDWRRTRRCTSA